MKFQSLTSRFDPIPVFNDRTSMTVPDMSYTPREIISKFSRGEKVPLGFQGLYDSEDDGNNLFGHDPQIFEEDPTRDPSFDFGDYVEEKHALEERQRQAKNRSKVKSGSASQRKASAEELSANDATTRETTSGEADHSPRVQVDS